MKIMTENEPENDLVFVEDQKRTNYTLDEIADKVAELALEKVLAKLEQLNPND